MAARVLHLEGSAAGRLVIIGDIHGCADQLRQLLTKVHFTNDAVRQNPTLLHTSPGERTTLDAAARMQVPPLLQAATSPNHSSPMPSSSPLEGMGGPALGDVDSPVSSTHSDHTGRGTTHDQAVHGRDQDLCVFVGDLVNKGPDSYGVVRTLRDIGAIGVVGNHDVALLRLVEKLRAGTPLTAKESASSLLPLAVDIPDDVYTFLHSIPHLLCFHAYHLVITHAGIDPSIPLETQTLEAATRMRNLVTAKKYRAQLVDVATGEPPHVALSLSDAFATLERPKFGKSWSKTWSKLACSVNGGRGAAVLPPKMEKKPRESWEGAEEEEDSRSSEDENGGESGVAAHRGKGKKEKWRKRVLNVYKGYTVVYGHDAKRRLQVHPYAYGIDSGCVYGGELTALVWPSTLVSVPGISNPTPHHKSNV